MGQNLVKRGTIVGLVCRPSHVEGTVSHVGPMGHVDHWARESVRNGCSGYWLLSYGSDGSRFSIMGH